MFTGVFRLVVFAELMVYGHDCGSSLSVCVDGWFILGAMITLMHHRCAAPPSQSPISLTQARWGCKPATNNTHSTNTLHNIFTSFRHIYIFGWCLSVSSGLWTCLDIFRWSLSVSSGPASDTKVFDFAFQFFPLDQEFISGVVSMQGIADRNKFTQTHIGLVYNLINNTYI